MKRIALIVSFAICSCSPEGLEDPVDATVEIELSRARSTEVERLRIALVWVLRNGTEPVEFVVSQDRAIDADEFTMRLAVFGRGNRGSPPESLSYGRLSAIAYRPRFVVYEDLDDNLRLDVEVFLGGGVDRIRGADADFEPRIAYQVSLDRLLQSLDLASTEAYYEATDGRYTPYVGVRSTPAGLVSGEPLPLRISVGDSPIPRTSVACERRIGGGPARPTALAVTVDTALDATTICATAATCDDRELEDVESPVVIVNEAIVAGVVCRRNANLEVLALHAATLECEGCLCSTAPTAEAYVAATGKTPSWWPCGDTLPFCSSEAGLFERDTRCD